jgi:DNA-binding response OmpR family regulator
MLPEPTVRVLVADDDPVTAAALAGSLKRWNFDVTIARDGEEAWNVISSDQPPSLAIVDWMMPCLDGVELCRRIRETPAHAHMYLVLLTARDSRADVIAGLEAGADDYLVKPFFLDELRARVNAGVRILSLQTKLAEQITMLEATLQNVRQLKGLLPMCSYCKSIRSDDDYWQQLEAYLSDHSDAEFSHGICPKCFDRVKQEFEA